MALSQREILVCNEKNANQTNLLNEQLSALNLEVNKLKTEKEFCEN